MAARDLEGEPCALLYLSAAGIEEPDLDTLDERLAPYQRNLALDQLVAVDHRAFVVDRRLELELRRHVGEIGRPAQVYLQLDVPRVVVAARLEALGFPFDAAPGRGRPCDE